MSHVCGRVIGSSSWTSASQGRLQTSLHHAGPDEEVHRDLLLLLLLLPCCCNHICNRLLVTAQDPCVFNTSVVCLVFSWSSFDE
mmetsp:Transcript_100321/g.251519  ORF Transcript_100321/g.251519 Transcript_100321/m.251519 type:complete len:84 (+) Transcript_100321:1930-2181(+)